jgi:hypothetical protein
VLETWIGGQRVYGGATRGERPADGPGR